MRIEKELPNKGNNGHQWSDGTERIRYVDVRWRIHTMHSLVGIKLKLKKEEKK